LQKLYTQNYTKNKPLLIFTFFISIFFISFLFAISVGSISIPLFIVLEILVIEVFNSVISVLSFGTLNFDSMLNDSVYETIIMVIRLPRVVLASIIGAALAGAGAAIQGLLRNPLGDPYIIGVSSGASVGAVIVLFFGITIPFLNIFTLPFISIVFGFITLLFVLVFAQIVDRMMRTETIILTGIIFSAFFSAIVSLMIALSGEELRQIVYWLLGSVSLKGWEYILAILPFMIVGCIILLMNSRELNVLAFGEGTATHLGMNVKMRKIYILIGTALLTGSAVAVSGVIGFVGLVIPHITRLLIGADHRLLIPLSFINGATFLVLADLFSRTIIAPNELPVGVTTALIGAPIFALIFFKQRHENKV
jgi:iron complex transport system permease protein